MKTNAKIVAMATDNPTRFEVKVKTSTSLAVYNVKARDAKQAIQRYVDQAFSVCTMSLSYSR